MENLKEWSEKEKNQHKEEEDKYRSSMPNYDTSSLTKMAGGTSMPSFNPSSLGNFSMPKL